MAVLASSRKRKHTIAALSVLAVLSMIPLLFSASPQSPKPVTSPASQTAAIRAGKHKVLGEQAVAPSYKLKITSLDIGELDTGTGTRRVSVLTTITNLSPDTLQVSPGLQMSLADTSGRLYPMTADYLPEGAVVGGPIAPGTSVDVSVDFKLPATAAPAQFIFQQDATTPATKVGL